jgi:HAE1 family hydrophobic/amphiphilic exporter-1
LIGGLTSSMLLTLVVVPVMYTIIDKIKDRFTKKKTEEVAEIKLLPASN